MPKSHTKVVLVDDNPVILDILRRGIEPFAEIAAFTDSTAALARCLASPPDLVICDYRMPEMNGGQFLQKLKVNADAKGVKVMLVASKSDIEEHLRSLTDMVEEFAQKPFYIKELAARAKKVLDRIQWEKIQQQASQEGMIRGRLSEMNLIDLFQSLELGQKTCGLTVTNDDEECSMYFQEGQLHHARLGSTVGDEAVYKVVSWADGSFQIDFNARSSEKSTTKSTQGLLMEALRLLDEHKRGSSGEPS
jgi:DNA-binding response OmpR family regulator